MNSWEVLEGRGEVSEERGYYLIIPEGDTVSQGPVPIFENFGESKFLRLRLAPRPFTFQMCEHIINYMLNWSDTS